jgi:hypothetical protein
MPTRTASFITQTFELRPSSWKQTCRSRNQTIETEARAALAAGRITIVIGPGLEGASSFAHAFVKGTAR